MTIEPKDLLAAADQLREGCRKLLGESRKVIVGQDEVLEQLLLAILARGHCLLVGVPGLAKTLMIRTLSEGLDCAFNRVQFTPDLMPSDITGTELLQSDPATGDRSFRFVKGPLFANIVLADEINRTPPKTQAALLEAMQERQVTVAGVRHPLPDPFFVLATQNPIEQEGTYPLPEAQQDRFLFSIRVDYPNEADECRIIETTTSPQSSHVAKVLAAAEVMRMQAVVREVPAADFVIQYAAKLTRMTRPAEPRAPDFVKQYITWGAGPRAGQSLILAAKARAVLHGRTYVGLDDVRAIAAPVLRHRILTNYSAEADNIRPDDLIAKLIAAMPKDGAVVTAAAELVARVERLELAARTIVEGLLAGRHRSPRQGFAVEFAQHREYSPGDDLRHIDWKVFGRTERHHIKQYEQETNLVAWLVVDASESMAYGSGTTTKYDTAALVAQVLATLIVRQSDAVSVAMFSDVPRQRLKPSASHGQLREVARVLAGGTSPGRGDVGVALEDLAGRLGRRAVVFIFSDFLDDLAPLASAIRHLKYHKHDVVLFQMLDPAEVEFPFRHPTLFQGLEQLPDITADPLTIREEYLAKFAEHERQLSELGRREAVEVLRLRTDADLGRELAAFLHRREAK